MVATYHQLGMLAQDRHRLDDAERWYRQALAINEELSNRPGMAMCLGQLGLLYEVQGRIDEALEWLIRGLALFDKFPHPLAGPGPAHLARLTAKLGIEALEQCWQRMTGQHLPQVVRDFVTAHPAQNAE